ncbi:MAG TPA: hypothetical protein VLG50_01740 [Candidatus Saccharimonadales bacterium]|nr:hypothetical protein [Candidatus Saccharimonadales bacterium]
MKISSLFLSISLLIGSCSTAMLGMQRSIRPLNSHVIAPIAAKLISATSKGQPIPATSITPKTSFFSKFGPIIIGSTIGTYCVINRIKKNEKENRKFMQFMAEKAKEEQRCQEDAEEFKKCPNWTEFIKRYRCSEQDEQKVQDGDTSIGYLKGLQLDRIQNACKLAHVIKQENLDTLAVAEKCLCKVGKDQWRVLSKKIDINPTDQPISLNELQQLVKVIQKTGFKDFGLTAYSNNGRNILRSKDGKLVFVDTEARSFQAAHGWGNFKWEDINRENELSYGIRHRRGIPFEMITQEGIAWIHNEYDKREKKSDKEQINYYKTLKVYSAYREKCDKLGSLPYNEWQKAMDILQQEYKQALEEEKDQQYQLLLKRHPFLCNEKHNKDCIIFDFENIDPQTLAMLHAFEKVNGQNSDIDNQFATSKS